MKKRFLLLLLLAILPATFLPGLAAEPTADEIVRNVTDLAAKIKTFQATVTQERTIDGASSKTVMKLWRAGTDRFRMESNQFWVIVNGETVWIKMGKNVSKKSLKEGEGMANPLAKQSLFFQFIAGSIDKSRFKKFEVKGEDTINGDKTYIIKATPKTGVSEQLWVRADNWLPVKDVINNHTDTTSDTKVTLSDFKIDAPIDDALFTYTGPVSK